MRHYGGAPLAPSGDACGGLGRVRRLGHVFNRPAAGARTLAVVRGGNMSNGEAGRAMEAGDRLRWALLLVALTGLGGAYLVRADSSTWIAASMLFGLAVLCCLVSLFTLKARELARARARAHGEPPPEFPKWDVRSSWTWDSLAFAFIAAGGTVLVAGFAALIVT
jgi:hypothetical protein